MLEFTCEASVSVRFFARLRHLELSRGQKARNLFERSEKSTETLATQAMVVPGQTTCLRVGRQATTAQRGKKKQLVPIVRWLSGQIYTERTKAPKFV